MKVLSKSEWNYVHIPRTVVMLLRTERHNQKAVLPHEACVYSNNYLWQATDKVLDKTSFVNHVCKLVCRK